MSLSPFNDEEPEFIAGIYLEPNNISGRELAKALGVAASTLSRMLSGSSRVTPEMALRLSKALGLRHDDHIYHQAQSSIHRLISPSHKGGYFYKSEYAYELMRESG